MKIGTENKRKTTIALVLAGLAILFVLNSLLNSGPSPSAAAPRQPIAAVATQDNPSNPAKAKKDSRRSDDKILTAVFKPTLDPSLNLKMLQESEDIEYKGSGRNIFEMTAQPKVIIDTPLGSGRTDKAVVTPTLPSGPPTPPPPPPINLKFYGYSTKSGQKTIFLSQGTDAVFVAHEGDIIARRYKIVHINPSSVEIQDLLNNNKQTITLTAG